MPTPRPTRSPAFAAPRLVRKPDVLRQTSLVDTSLRNLVAAEGFPRPVRLGPRTQAWRADEVDRWITNRIAERNRTTKGGE
jgi:prophage regulatory protein